MKKNIGTRSSLSSKYFKYIVNYQLLGGVKTFLEYNTDIYILK